MKRIIQYILLLVMGTVVSCQTPELIEGEPTYEQGVVVSGKVPIIFKASIPAAEPETKAMAHVPDIRTFHLVIFDENGMFVEIAQAELVGQAEMDENKREYVQAFKVIVTLSDQPRIVHFIANCPVDQVVYGHEASIIGNMFVENGETAYWSRAWFPHIQVVDEVYDEATGAHHFHPCEHMSDHLMHVHLLRNFAEISVEDQTPPNDEFELLGFTVYNTINKGTVAPYNNKYQQFQCFVDEKETGSGVVYDYDEMMEIPYEGHALLSAKLNQKLPVDEAGNYIWYDEDHPFFMYERKVSVRTDEEDKWNESPPHVIVKAKYNDVECYYKFDLVYNIMGKDTQGKDIVTDIKYYNILRNFLYRFRITDVHSPGYETPEEAMKGVTSNNLAGSTTTSGLKEVAVGLNRIAVSFTDTTIVNSGPIRFRYKYEPNYNEAGATPQNSSDYVKLLDADGEALADDGDVIESHAVAANNIQGGDMHGYRDVVFNIKEPGDQIMEQVVTVKPQDYQLTRRIRFILRKKLKMTVECEPRIMSGIDVEQYVKIRLQPGLTADMFPLHLSIETEDLSLSPDASKNSIPVVTGKSTIPIPSKNGKRSFYFDYVIESYDDYNNSELFPRDKDNYRIINTYWRTNCVDNASTVYVTNKYFDTENASDSWTNVSYAWSNVAVSTQNIPKGLDREVSITFTKDASDNNQQRQVEVTLDGMKYNGNSTFTVTIPANTKTYTVNGLKTTSEEGKVGFSLDNASYMLASATSGDRVGNRFENADFAQGSVGLGIGNEVQYSFRLPTYYSGMEVNVTLDGLAPADDETRLEAPVDGRSAIKSYVFRPTGTGTYTLKLQTTNKDESTCSLMLEAEKYYYETVTSTIEQTAAKYAFQSLTISDVRYGTGRAASITFVLDADDNNIRNKEVYVKLVGMTNNEGKDSFTHKVANNDRTITINNLKTTSNDGILRVTVEAAEYMPITTTISQRTLGEFKNVKFNKTKVGAKVGEVVELSFNIDNNSYYSGMVVNLELDGLEPVDGNYPYTVTKSGDHKISLRTTQAIEGGECKAKLKADGMVDSQVVTVTQTRATHALKASNTKSNANNNVYDCQAVYQMSSLTQGGSYKLVFYAKADQQIDRNNFSIYLKTTDGDGQQRQLDNLGPVTTAWNRWEIDLNQNQNSINYGNYNMLAFNIGKVVSGNAIYFDKVSLVEVGSGREFIINGDFEESTGADFLSSEENKYDGNKAPTNTWWVKMNTRANPQPDCTLEIVENGYEGTTP